VLCLSMEIFTFAQLCYLYEPVSNANNDGLRQSFLITSPVFFSILIIFKWLQFMFGCVMWEFFGLTVLPAFYSMTSTESLKFLVYMGLLLIMCTHAYWSLPLQNEDYELAHPNGSFFISMFRMFRLTVMGDFDSFELEGIDPQLQTEDNITQLDENPADWAADATNPGKAKDFHVGIRVMTMAFGTAMTIIAMNMYIGVLSVAYNDNSALKYQLYGHAKSKFVLRYLLRKRAWKLVLWVFSCGRCCNPWDEDLDDLPRDGYSRFAQEVAQWAEQFSPEDSDGTDEDGEVNDTNLPQMPSDFVEHNLPENWQGFWCTVPDDLLPQSSDADEAEQLRDNQRDLKTKVDRITQTIAKLQDKMNSMAQRKGVPVGEISRRFG